jgi:hypothetical protein
MIKTVKIYPLLLSTIVLMTANCSVHKAASNEGVAVRDIRKCEIRGCFLSKGMEVLERREEKGGKYTETYRAKARKSGANYIRAAGHGVLDIATLGLWEVVGTPVEGAISNNRGYIIAHATYASKDSDTIEKIEIYDAKGRKIQ